MTLPDHEHLTAGRRQEQDAVCGGAVGPYIYAGTANQGYCVALPKITGRKPRWFSASGMPIADAYSAARGYRDRYLPPSHRSRVLRAEARATTGRVTCGVVDRTRSSLGKPGLDIVGNGRGPRDGTNRFIQASASDPATGKPQTMRFSIRELGFDTALRYGLRKRLEWERRFYAHRSSLDVEAWHVLASLVHNQLGEAKVALSELDHPGSASLHATGIQARLSIYGETYTAWFGYKAHSSFHEAHAAAIVWLVRQHSEKRRSTQNIRRQVTSANKSTDRVGVCRRVIRDGRNRAETVIYETSVQIDGRGYPVRFRVGRLDAVDELQERIAFGAASDCRAAYEKAHALGEPFDKTAWKHWKYLYGFPVPRNDATPEI